MELYMQNREHERMILESVEHGPLIWPMVEENGGHLRIVYSLMNHHKVAKDLWERVQLLMQVAYQSPQAPTQLITESPFVDSCFVIPVFSSGDDPIACLNKAMAVASSRFPSTNNQLRTSSNPRHHATIQDGRVTVQLQELLNATTAKVKGIWLGNALSQSDQGMQHAGDKYGHETGILDTYDFLLNVDESLDAQAVLMAYISNFGFLRRRLNGGFETYKKLVFNNEIIPFLKSLKDIFNVFDKDLLNEITEVQTVFDQMEVAVQQSSVDKQCLEIAKKEILLENDRLLQKIMSQDVMLTVMNSMSFHNDSVNMEMQECELCEKCLNLDAELSKSKQAYNDFLKNYSQLEKHSRLQDKDKTICKLKDTIKSLRENTKEENVNPDKCDLEPINKELENSGAKLLSENESLCNEINHVKQVVQIVLWYLDSGCLKHMTGNRSQLMNFVSKFLGTVRFRNDHIARIMGYGDYQLGNVIISRVYYVEGLRHSLFSVGQFCDADLEVAFWKNTCFIRNLEGVDLLSGSRDTNLYTISLDDMLKSSLICLLSKASKTKSWLWHRRLSHLNFGTLNKLAKDGLARGIPRLKFQKDHLFLKTKDEAPAAIIKCIKNIQVRLKATVQNVRTDNGTEFVNQTLCEWYENVGITHQTFVARTPQQNGVVERDDWDWLFQPMFDEYFNPPTIVVSPVPEAAAPRAEVLADSPVSTSIDQDAPSTSIPSSQEQEHSPIISQGFEESPKTPTFHDDPLNESP
ncbi:retrovirus-related pol polyprotein from transposon TNT 1-94, partial [Tanacetum coccineum]